MMKPARGASPRNYRGGSPGGKSVRGQTPPSYGGGMGGMMGRLRSQAQTQRGGYDGSGINPEAGRLPTPTGNSPWGTPTLPPSTGSGGVIMGQRAPMQSPRTVAKMTPSGYGGRRGSYGNSGPKLQPAGGQVGGQQQLINSLRGRMM